MPRMLLDGTAWVLFIQSSIFIRLFIFHKNKGSLAICLVLLKHMTVLSYTNYPYFKLLKLSTSFKYPLINVINISVVWHSGVTLSVLSFFLLLFFGGRIIPQVRIAHSWVKKPVVLISWNCPHALN